MCSNTAKHCFLCFLNFLSTLFPLHSLSFLLYSFLYSSTLFYLSFPCNNSAYPAVYLILLLLLFLCSFYTVSSFLSYFPPPSPSLPSNYSPFQPHFHCVLVCLLTFFLLSSYSTQNRGITSFVG
jgi:hypothetical protein